MAGFFVLLSAVLAALFLVSRRRQRSSKAQAADPEKDLRQMPLDPGSAKELATAESVIGEVARPLPAVVCKSVFAESCLPDQHDWAVPSSWGGRIDGISTENPYRLINAAKLKEGTSAPMPEGHSDKDWALHSLISAEPPKEVCLSSNTLTFEASQHKQTGTFCRSLKLRKTPPRKFNKLNLFPSRKAGIFA